MSPLRWRYLGAHPQMEMLLKREKNEYIYYDDLSILNLFHEHSLLQLS